MLQHLARIAQRRHVRSDIGGSVALLQLVVGFQDVSRVLPDSIHTCSPSPSVCNVSSGNIRSPHNVDSFSGRGTRLAPSPVAVL